MCLNVSWWACMHVKSSVVSRMDLAAHTYVCGEYTTLSATARPAESRTMTGVRSTPCRFSPQKVAGGKLAFWPFALGCLHAQRGSDGVGCAGSRSCGSRLGSPGPCSGPRPRRRAASGGTAGGGARRGARRLRPTFGRVGSGRSRLSSRRATVADLPSSCHVAHSSGQRQRPVSHV